MKTDVIHTLTDSFEAHSQQTENGIEFWLASDLQQLLGYAEWRNFSAVITKGKTACEVSGYAVSDHFVDVNKMVNLGSGSQRIIDDIHAYTLCLLPDCPKWRLEETGNSLCPDLFCHPDSSRRTDRTTTFRS